MPHNSTDHIVGCILGGAIGDAVGGPYEGKGPSSNPGLNGRRVSDDTQLTLANFSAIIQDTGRVFPSTITSRFVSCAQSADESERRH